MNKRPKILYLVTEDWYFYSHRLPLARAAKQDGFDVVIATQVNHHGDAITAEGFRLIPISLRRRTMGPFRELMAIWQLLRLYRAEKPSIVHQVGMKPVIYGSLAAHLAGVPAIVNALAGLGYVFTSKQRLAKVLRPLVKAAFRWLIATRRSRLIVQNPDDRQMLLNVTRIVEGDIVMIKSSGVDLERFRHREETPGVPVVMLASRMLWDKGVGIFVEVARILTKQGVRARFVLVGAPDAGNPTTVTPQQLMTWQEEAAVEWWGYREDMPSVLESAHIVCLPSTYGEGVPKILIEAAACGRPIVGTDIPGCREVVQHGENGLLVPVNNVDALIDALKRLIENPALRKHMGTRGREIAMEEFSVEKVVRETLSVYRELLS